MPKVILKPKSNFDLLPKNPRPGLLKLESSQINVEIEIETKAPNSAKTDRWTKVAEEEMQRYREIVQDTVDKVTDKWEKGEGKPLSEREKDVKELSTSIGGAVKSMEAAIGKVVRQQIEREARGDKNLLEARIAVAVKGTFKVIAIGKDVAEVAVTGGADVSAWLALAKDIVSLAKLVQDQCKGEPRLREDLLKAIGSYCSTKQRRWDEAKKAKDWKAKAKLLAKEIWSSEKSLANKAEDQRKKYRNEVSAMIEKVDKIGDKRDKLQKGLEKSGGIDAKSLAARALKVKLGGSIKTLNARILDCQKFVDDMAFLLTENGVEVDDSTALEKLKDLRNLGSIAEAGNAVYKAATDVLDIVESIKG